MLFRASDAVLTPYYYQPTSCFLGKIFWKAYRQAFTHSTPGSASLHPGLFLVPPLRGSGLGGHPPPGSAPLHLGLLMVPPLRGWGGSQVIRAKREATLIPTLSESPDRTAKETSRPDRTSADNLIRQDNNPTKNQCSSVSIRG
jgi:hypothetical protein